MFGLRLPARVRRAVQPVRKSPLRFEALESRKVFAADPLPVLLVIANETDFFYQEYGDTKIGLEAEGLSVRVAATTTHPSRPHPNTGEPVGTDGTIVPDIALADVDAADYSAIAFVGGWGASMYQYAVNGNYVDDRYDGDAATRQVVNDLINDFVDQDKFVAAVCHGVTVLAWARVDGVSPLAGKQVAQPFGGGPAVSWQGSFFGYFALEDSVQVAANGGIPSSQSGIRGADPVGYQDDVVVDGKIITAENNFTALAFGHTLGQEIMRDLTPPPPLNQTPSIANQQLALAENSASGVVVGNVLAADADAGQSLTYAIVGGNLNNAFTIDPATGAIAVANSAALDFETTPLFSLAVQVTDNAAEPLSATATIQIQLTDVNETPSPGVTFANGEMTIRGTAGTDYIYVWSGAANQQVFAWFAGTVYGPYTVAPGGTRVRVFGGDGSDYIYATDARVSVQIHGEGGHDLITGGTASDLLFGGDGTDRISGLGGDDLIRGEGGSDYLYGNAGNDLLLGGDGDDWIEGAEGDDVIVGGLGWDSLRGGAGNDVLIGGRLAQESDASILQLQSLWLTSEAVDAKAEQLATTLTIEADAASDVLCGAEGADLLFAAVNDWVCFEEVDRRRVTA